jgi:deazaflavin-dependent oxidoreductase (nitroreductase family)
MERAMPVPRWISFFNPIAKALLGLGVPMGPDVLLTVRGRKSGLPRSTPVAVAELAGRLWVISPFGEVDWARNLRAAGRGTIRSGARLFEVTARELDEAERVAFYRDVLAPYLRSNKLAAWIVAVVDRLPADPVAAAAAGPVFELRRAA